MPIEVEGFSDKSDCLPKGFVSCFGRFDFSLFEFDFLGNEEEPSPFKGDGLLIDFVPLLLGFVPEIKDVVAEFNDFLPEFVVREGSLNERLRSLNERLRLSNDSFSSLNDWLRSLTDWLRSLNECVCLSIGLLSVPNG